MLRYIHQNTLLLYLMFFMYLILPSHCFLFKNFVVIIMFILNFTTLCFMLWTSTPRQCSFSSQSNNGLYVCSIILPHQFLKFIGLFAYLFLLILVIIDCAILFPVFSIVQYQIINLLVTLDVHFFNVKHAHSKVIVFVVGTYGS